MTDDVRSIFLAAARAMADLVASPEVAAAWDAPSALDRMTVGDLTAHLARAGLLVQVYLDASPASTSPASTSPASTSPADPAPEPVDAAGYYGAFSGFTDVDSPLSAGVRERARQGAADGPQAVSAAAAEAVAWLERTLPGLPADQRITVRDGIVLTLEDYLRTRIVELAVHTDDLVAGIPALAGGVSGTRGEADALEDARALAIDTLVGLALRRHGSTAVLRALARRERDDVQALRVL